MLSDPPPSIRIPKAAEVVASYIRKAIARGELKSGDSLPAEAQMIATFEVSRPTIREATRILESEHLVSVSRGARGGARINEPGTDLVMRSVGFALQQRGATLADVYQARTIIEPSSARVAAETRPVEAAAALRQQIKAEMNALHNATQRQREAATFHRILLEQSGNLTMSLLALALSAVVEKHNMLAYRDRLHESEEARQKQARTGIKAHEKLVRLIGAGQGMEAEEFWRLHMRKVGEMMYDRVAQMSLLDVLD